MPRILGVTLPDNKKIRYALTDIKGVGLRLADEIILKLNFDQELRAKDLTEDDLSRLSSLLDKEYVIGGELSRRVRDNIKRIKDIGTYRGQRHKRGLPVRGQKTRYNARTRKGPRKSVAGVSVRKTVSKK